jgi:chitinase
MMVNVSVYKLGVDLDYEDNDAMNIGTGEAWLIECTKIIRKHMPKGQYILTHAPQAPYFQGAPMYPNGGYLKVDQEVGDLIDWYNIQFYNQGDDPYDTYENLFVNSKGHFNNTAIG